MGTQRLAGNQPSLSERLYARLLLVYPPGYRRRYGPLMLQLFRDQYRDARRAGGHGRWQLWWRVGAELAQTAGSEYVDELKEALMHTPTQREGAGRTMGLLLASVLIAGSLIGKALIFEYGGSTALALAVLLASHLAAGLLLDRLMGARGLAFMLMALLMAATLLPLLWVPNSRLWLRENPLLGGVFVIILAGYYQPSRPRGPLYAAAGILAGVQILVSFI